MKAKSKETTAKPSSKFKLPKIWPVVASAVLLALAFPPFNLGLLVFVALAPLLVYLRNTDGKGAVKAGYLFGFVYFLFQMYWIFPFVKGWTGSAAMGAAPYLLCAFLAGFFYLLACWLINLCYRMRMPYLIPFVWAGVEGLRAYFPILAFPWAFVAHPLWKFPWLVQHAAFGTVIMVSAWVVLFNIIVSETLLRDQNPQRHAPVEHIFRYGMVFAGLFFLGATRMSFLPNTERHIITGGQPGVNMAFNEPEKQAQELAVATVPILNAAIRQETDLLVFPEGYAASVYAIPPDTSLGPHPAVPVIIGGQRFADGTSYQSAIAWDGQKWQFADKTRLVVMGEYVPFRDQLPFLRNFGVALEDLSPAEELKTLQINDMKVGALICFEGVFPDLAEKHSRQGAQLLVQMSIDDWYEDTPAYEQLWQSTIWRSIESGLPIVRVGARGRSLVTDNRGNLKTLAPVGKTIPIYAPVDLPPASDAFPYRTYFIYLCYALGLFPFFLFQYRRFKLKSSNKSHPK